MKVIEIWLIWRLSCFRSSVWKNGEPPLLILLTASMLSCILRFIWSLGWEGCVWETPAATNPQQIRRLREQTPNRIANMASWDRWSFMSCIGNSGLLLPFGPRMFAIPVIIQWVKQFACRVLLNPSTFTEILPIISIFRRNIRLYNLCALLDNANRFSTAPMIVPSPSP